ncbi:MAG: hypothetical protein M1167_04235 [Chloroflexi bacterium]|nr:hypothetical protein [Chloroflexota bacterium]
MSLPLPYVVDQNFSVLLAEISTINLQFNAYVDAEKQLPAKAAGRR